jgi:hypothetical protein
MYSQELNQIKNNSATVVVKDNYLRIAESLPTLQNYYPFVEVDNDVNIFVTILLPAKDFSITRLGVEITKSNLNKLKNGKIKMKDIFRKAKNIYILAFTRFANGDSKFYKAPRKLFTFIDNLF